MTRVLRYIPARWLPKTSKRRQEKKIVTPEEKEAALRSAKLLRRLPPGRTALIKRGKDVSAAAGHPSMGAIPSISRMTMEKEHREREKANMPLDAADAKTAGGENEQD